MGKAGLTLTFLGAVALFACAPTESGVTAAQADDIDGEADAVCAADDFAYLIGESRADAAAANLPEPYRIYGVNDAVTMDYIATRINVVVGEDEIVTEVKCG